MQRLLIATAAIGALDLINLISVASFFQRKSVRCPSISLPFCRAAAVLRSFFQGLSSHALLPAF
jgi:hypothetical protein